MTRDLPCHRGCGYYSHGDDLAKHEREEHVRCPHCESEPRDPYAVSHKPDCLRLTGGDKTWPVSGMLPDAYGLLANRHAPPIAAGATARPLQCWRCPGLLHWSPEQQFSTDGWKCPDCGAEMLGAPPVVGPMLFELHRGEDITGVSGTGVVACGVEFADGQVVIRWAGEYASTVVWASLDAAMHVHGHDGKTRVAWLPRPAAAAGPGTDGGE